MLATSPLSSGVSRSDTVVIIDHRPMMCFALHAVLSKVAKQVFMIDNGDVTSDQVLEASGANTVVFSAHAPPHHDNLQLLVRLRADGQQTRLALYGATLDYKLIMTALRADIDGLLLESATLDEFTECYAAISGGGKWLSQAAMHLAMIEPIVEAGTPQHALGTLTPRQKDIARMISQGRSNKQIAEATHLAEGTVKMHINRIFRRLKIPNRATLAAVVGDRLRDDSDTLIAHKRPDR